MWRDHTLRDFNNPSPLHAMRAFFGLYFMAALIAIDWLGELVATVRLEFKRTARATYAARREIADWHQQPRPP